ncbi:hypothetical protein AB6A40_011660 [Gnathostoma spinigerum]|uniref:C2H2-type domain-containing protein n=1 Tax=Gnathostoma spinigerum TaxID=75299 RepID=A0ABD6EYF3_9BILA
MHGTSTDLQDVSFQSAFCRIPHGRRECMCAECHKMFYTPEELYMHAEACLIESFENEAASVFSDMPCLKSPPPFSAPTPNGITVKVKMFAFSF